MEGKIEEMEEETAEEEQETTEEIQEVTLTTRDWEETEQGQGPRVLPLADQEVGLLQLQGTEEKTAGQTEDMKGKTAEEEDLTEETPMMEEDPMEEKRGNPL